MKRFRFLITFILVFLLLPISAISFSADENPVWDGNKATGFAGGTGTSVDPFIIQTAQQLAFLASSTNSGTSYEGAYIILTADIVLNNTSNWENWGKTAPANRWNPIGNDGFGFSGSFNGNGHTVSGVYINSGDFRGLFGSVYINGTVDNVGVVKSYIKGISNIGGVVGNAFTSTVRNCYFTGTVSGNFAVGGVVGYLNKGTVSGCYNTGAVSGIGIDGNKDGIGGVVGYAIAADPSQPAVISNCYNTAAVTGTGNQNGGVAGSAISCNIKNCSNTGMVNGDKRIGGVAGYINIGSISNCYNIGAVNGKSEYVGGVAGWAISCTIDNSYNTGMISGDINVGGVAGDIASTKSAAGAVNNCYNIGKVTGNKNVGGVAGWVLGIQGAFSSGNVNKCNYLKGAASGGINGADVSGQAVSLTDAQMKQREVFADWDLVNVWEFGGSSLNYYYPTLIGVEHRDIGSAVSVMENNVKPNTGRILLIVIVCIIVAALLIAYVFYTKKQEIEKL